LVGSSPVFVRTGITNATNVASLKLGGEWLVPSERLKSTATNGASRSASCLGPVFDVESAGETRTGSYWMALTTSSIAKGEKANKDAPDYTRLNVGVVGP
jgi:hypothetical protein